MEWKDRKLIELACTQLNQAWEQLIENHREFQALCEDNKDLQEADTWLFEPQALINHTNKVTVKVWGSRKRNNK